MKQGEAAIIRARADFAYGSEGIIDRGILPHATLNFHIHVLRVEQSSASASSAEEQLLLPAPGDANDAVEEDEVTTVVVGGAPVRFFLLVPLHALAPQFAPDLLKPVCAPNRLRHRYGSCHSITCQEASVCHRCDACRRAPATLPQLLQQ